MSGHLDFQESLLPVPPESLWHIAQTLQDGGQAATSLSHSNSLELCLVEPHSHWNSHCKGVWEM